jgi:short subunit dehydrogenase-like uncharacterized protein
MEQWLIYGANGYTGALLAAEAVKRGYRPLLGGRSIHKLRPLAERLKLEAVAFDLDPTQVASRLRERQVKLVLHAAGPFIYTSRPMLDACLATGTHYLDLAGEISVFENTYAHDQAARDRGIVLISGVGFDLVPSSCLIQYVIDQVNQPASVEVVVSVSNGELDASAGTLKTDLEMIAEGIVVRRNGRLVPVKLGTGVKSVRLLDGQHTALIVPWGDVIAAYYSTGIPNITAYLTFPAGQALALRYAGMVVQRLLRNAALRHWVARRIDRYVSGPSEHLRQTGRSQLYAQVRGKNDQRAEAWLETVEAYQFTMLAALNAVERVFQYHPSGALTPAQAFGADFVLEVAQTIRRDTL